jgi:ATP-dependent Lhr-like helicase
MGGRPVIYVERGGRSLLTFSAQSTESAESARSEGQPTTTTAARLLVEAVRAGTVGALTIRTVNGVAVMEPGGSAPVRAALEEAGFALTPRGYRVPR